MEDRKAIEVAYPDNPELRALAEKVEKDLNSYRIPSSVAKKTGQKNMTEIAGPWLIVLCTPDTPKSPEIIEKIKAFTAAGYYSHILTVLVSGRPEESFPRELLFEELPDGTVTEHEPLAANIAADSLKESLGLFSVEKLRLLASILGVSFDELRNRRGRSRMILGSVIASAVILAASLFLVYAVRRMKVISGQTAVLEAEYEKARDAAERAQVQRDAAREEYAATTAIRAREVLDGNDTELTMLLCLDFLPEAGLSSDLPSLLKEALDRRCAQGYVPVTTAKEYTKTRTVGRDPAEDSEEEPVFPKKITLPIPEGYDDSTDSYELDLELSSEEFGYAVYRGSFRKKRGSSATIYRTRICFADDPSRDYYMPFWDGTPGYRWLTAGEVLPDGSFLGTAYPDYDVFRCDPFQREFVPFYDEEAEGQPGTAPEEDAPIPLALRSDIERIYSVPGIEDLLFACTWSDGSLGSGPPDVPVKTYVFTRKPFRYRETIEDVILFSALPGSDYVLGTTGSRLMVYRAEPFEHLYDLEDGYTGERLAAHYYEAVVFPDGREWMYARKTGGKAVYDLKAGKMLSEITEPNQDYDFSIASDGMIVTSVNSTPTLFRPEDASIYASIPGEEETDPTLFGDYDETTGKMGHERIRAGSILYEWQEEPVPVPGDLAGQIALAEELLAGRQLTRKERKAYGLELE